MQGLRHIHSDFTKCSFNSDHIILPIKCIYLTNPVMMALRRVLLSSSLLTKRDDERFKGREPCEARLDMSWATRHMT